MERLVVGRAWHQWYAYMQVTRDGTESLIASAVSWCSGQVGVAFVAWMGAAREAKAHSVLMSGACAHCVERTLKSRYNHWRGIAMQHAAAAQLCMSRSGRAVASAICCWGRWHLLQLDASRHQEEGASHYEHSHRCRFFTGWRVLTANRGRQQLSMIRSVERWAAMMLLSAWQDWRSWYCAESLTSELGQCSAGAMERPKL